MSPLKGEFDNAAELPQGKLFDVWSKERRSLSSPFLSFFFSCSLILQWIFKSYSDLFIAAQCSASQSYFQVDVFTGRREGTHIDLYMGGVTLDFVTVLSGVPERVSFCCCLKGSVTFSSSFPPGLKQSELAWFHQPPGTIYQGFVWEDKEQRKGSFTSQGQLLVAGWLHANISSYCCVSQPDGANMKTMSTSCDLPSHSA